MENKMSEKCYILQYKYYQYNDGSSNNGTYTGSLRFNSIKEASKLFEKIFYYLNNQLTELEKSELEENLIPYAGYIVGGLEIYEKQFICDSINHLEILKNKESLEKSLKQKEKTNQLKM